MRFPDNLRDGPSSWGGLRCGSTRGIAILRIALALIVWVRFADEIAPYNAHSPAFLSFAAWVFIWSGMALVGWFARLALALLALTLLAGYVFLGGVLQTPGWAHHHVFLLIVTSAILAMTPCDRSYSLRRWRQVRAARASGSAVPEEAGSLWAVPLLGLQLSAVYFWAAVDKSDWAWLNGHRLEQIMTWTYEGRALAPLMIWMPFLVAASIAVLVVEYLLAFAIHVRRWHRWVLPLGVATHALFYLLLPVDTYSVTMVALYIALIPAATLHRFTEEMQGYAATPHRL